MKLVILMVTALAIVALCGYMTGYAGAINASCRHAGWDDGKISVCIRTYPSGNGSQVTETAPWPMDVGAPGTGTRIKIP